MGRAAAVYAQELIGHGHGYPLWIPEPAPTKLGEGVRIGDVGYIFDGSFFRLFNVLLPSTHPINEACKPLPDPFKPLLNWGENWSCRKVDPYINSGAISSKSVKRADIQAQIGGKAPTPA